MLKSLVKGPFRVRLLFLSQPCSFVSSLCPLSAAGADMQRKQQKAKAKKDKEEKEAKEVKVGADGKEVKAPNDGKGGYQCLPNRH